MVVPPESRQEWLSTEKNECYIHVYVKLGNVNIPFARRACCFTLIMEEVMELYNDLWP